MVWEILNTNLLIETYQSPIVIKFDFESVTFWCLRFAALSKVQLPIIGLPVDCFFMKQFLYESYYCIALFCDVFGCTFSLSVSF